MEQKERIYYNRSCLTSVQRGEVGADKHKVAKLIFSAYDRQKKEQVTRAYTMWLTQENNERNQETLQVLGVTAVPSIVNFEAFDEEIPGLGNNVVDLVAETDGEYENVKYINPPKFDLKAWDMKKKAPF